MKSGVPVQAETSRYKQIQGAPSKASRDKPRKPETRQANFLCKAQIADPERKTKQIGLKDNKCVITTFINLN